MELISKNRSTTVGLVGLFLFAIFCWVDVVNNDIGIVLMLAASAYRYKEIWKVMRHEPLTYLFFVFACYIIVMGYYSGLSLPETKDAQWEAIGKWLRIWLFLLIAWWLNGNTRRICLVWVLAYIGFSAQVVTSFNWDNWEVIFNNERLSLGLNFNATTLIAGIGIIGLIISLPRTIPLVSHSYRRIIGAIVVYLLASTILIESMLLTGSRAAWIAVAITLAFSSIYIALKNTRLLKKKNYIFGIMSVAFVLALFTYSHQDRISNRFHQEDKLAHTLINDFDIKKIPYSSAGRRIHLWYFGFNRWIEKPFLGWGPGTIVTKHIKTDNFGTKFEDMEAFRLQSHPHLHNAYLSTLVRFGIVGTLIILAVFIIFNYYIWKEYKEGIIDRYILFFYIASATTFLIVNLTSFRLFTQEDSALIYLIFGSIYSYRLARLKRDYT